jgi:O-methyltransferase
MIKDAGWAKMSVSRQKLRESAAVRGLLRRLTNLVGPPPSAPTLELMYEHDSSFRRAYAEGLKVTGTPDVIIEGYPKRFVRFYNTVQYLLATQHLDGDVIECGCWRGLSMYIFATLERERRPDFNGERFHIVDSFEGLAVPGLHDGNEVPAGAYACSKQDVRAHLAQFPALQLTQGWLPVVLGTLPARRYRFVHIDVDHYEPIKGALQYFYPLLVPGGFILVDDYGSDTFPGARRAVEEFASESKLPYVGLSSAQAVLWR